MTRFARAHGSKSSNERLPEEATSWNVMKQQLQHKLQSSESAADANKPMQKIWKSSDFEPDAWNRKNAAWAEFEENSGSVNRDGKKIQRINHKTRKEGKKKNINILNEYLHDSVDGQKKSKKKKLKNLEASNIEVCDLSTHANKPLNTESTTKTKKKELKKGVNTKVCDDTQPVIEHQAVDDRINTSHPFSPAKKQKPKNKLGFRVSTENEPTQKLVSSSFKDTGENINEKTVVRKRKRDRNSISEMVDQPIAKLRHKYQGTEHNFKSADYTESENSIGTFKNVHKKKKKYAKDENKIEQVTDSFQFGQHMKEKETETQDIKSDVQTLKEKKQKQKHFENSFQGVDNKSPKKENFPQDDTKGVKSKNSYMQMEKKQKRSQWQHQNGKMIKKNNFVGTDNTRKHHGNRKKHEHVTILRMNGREIQVVKFDGFPVKREDAENLKILKQKLIANGVPMSEIKMTMKLERRKAEKALAREKKKVCFHCRNSGHVLSECPELEKAEMEDASGTGICFKCGSTEHKYFECRVTREQEFRHAKCFVCKEQGHIARQCPDNPRGLYPKGGGCHVCGDVTHLKKDCPDLIKEKEQKTIRLPTLSTKSLEVLEDDNKNAETETTKQKYIKKTVKF